MDYKTIGGRSALLLAAGMLFGSPLAGAVDRGEMIAYTCVGCHGPGGNSVGPASPNIAGWKKDTMVDSMKAFAAGEDRPSTIMGRIAKGYTDEELEAMAEYFAKQKPVFPEQKYDAALAEKGAKYHEDYCDKCHEDNGKKDEDGSGILAGQWIPYMEYQMADYMSDKRPMSKKMRKRMEKMVEEQGKESMDAVVHYYASQK